MRIPERDVTFICLLIYTYPWISTDPEAVAVQWISMDKRKEKFLHWVRVIVRGYLRVRFDRPSSITYEI